MGLHIVERCLGNWYKINEALRFSLNGGNMKKPWGIYPLEDRPLVARPVDANPMEDGNPYTPWYNTEEHVHVGEDGFATSVHIRGNGIEELKETFEKLKNVPFKPGDVSLDYALWCSEYKPKTKA